MCAERKVQLSTGTARSPLRLQCVAVRSSGSVFLDPAEERIVDVTYPSAADPVHVHYSILGDDSVLLKYLNPHVALVTSVAANSAPAAASTTVAAASVTPADSGDAAGADGGAASEDEGPSNAMYWTLVDTVTGRIIVRLQQDSAALPAHSVIIENHVVSTYWNSKVWFVHICFHLTLHLVVNICNRFITGEAHRAVLHCTVRGSHRQHRADAFCILSRASQQSVPVLQRRQGPLRLHVHEPHRHAEDVHAAQSRERTAPHCHRTRAVQQEPAGGPAQRTGVLGGPQADPPAQTLLRPISCR